MAVVSKTRTYSSGDILTANFYNEDRDEIIAGVNDIEDAQISGTAAIQLTKLADGTLPVGIQITSDNFPDGVTLTGTQTLTNKTLVKPQHQASYQNYVTATDGAIVTFDLSTSNIQEVTLGGNRTLTVTNPVVGQPFMVRLIQDGVGSRTATWWTDIKWTGGSAPTLTTTADAVDVFGFVCTYFDGLTSYEYDGYFVSFDLR